MYCEHFGFREKPFSMTPDPRFIFLSRNHREAFAHLLYGIDNRAGFIALTGEVGAGKTTVLRTLLTQLDPERYCTSLIFNPSPSPLELLRSINREYGIPSEGNDPARLLESLNEFLLEQNRSGKTVVLVIDEAQHLGPPVLEQVRLISNLETDTEKLVQIVLAGQPELGRILKRTELRQLDQRISVRYHLQPMDFGDTVGYIKHRLKVVNGKGKAQFTSEALRLIYRYSGGLPRLINIACDRALLAAYTKDTEQITAGITRAAVADVKKSVPRPAWHLAAGLGAVMVLLIAAAFFYLGGARPAGRTAETPVAKQPVVRMKVKLPEETPLDLAKELAGRSAREDVRAAFDAVAAAWKVAPANGGTDLRDARSLERAARERGLSLLRYSGNLDFLLRTDSPVLLEMKIPGSEERRLIALTGAKGGKLQVRPVLGGNGWLSAADVERYWTGECFILWRNALNLPPMRPGSRGAHVKKLQGLLAEAKTYEGQETGVYDRKTRASVLAFQSARGINQNGLAGQWTLMLLYRSIPRFETPGLNR